MAYSLNRVILIGNVGKDPEVRSTQDGREIASFSLATSESWKDKTSGERKEKTEWHKVVIFSQPLVTLVKNHVKKGTKLYVEGAVHTRKWADQSGIEKYTTEIVLQSFNSMLMLLDGKPIGANGEVSREPSNLDHSGKNDYVVENLDDDIPF